MDRRDPIRQAAYDKQRRLNNPQKLAESNRKWRARKSPAEKANSLRKIEDWVKNNLDRAKASIARWRAEHPEASRVNAANRRAAKADGMTVRVNRKIIALLMSEQGGKCPYCLSKLDGTFEIDHFMPIALGGKHEEDNLQLTCMSCNRKKSGKHPLLFKLLGAP